MKLVCKKCLWGKRHHAKEVNCPRQGWISPTGRDSANSRGGTGECILSETEKGKQK